MGIDFDIVESQGPLIQDPIRSMAQVDALRPLQPAESMPFVGEVLTRLRQSVGNEAAVLGFVGAPWTLAAYVVEGKSSKNYAVIKAMAFQEPQLLHRLLDHFAESIAAYLRYQIDSGAQVVQMFDSWAGQLSPIDYDTFAAPYQKKVVDLVKQTHPDTPFILYISGSAGVIERMARTGVDIVSLDWTVDMAEGLARLPEHVGVQGNVDPGLLFGTPDAIRARIDDTVRKARGRKHILNLGHGILPGTPEENGAAFFEAGKTVMDRIQVAA
jgi:uroporphyrinogen decarboxylase